tara:strand:+ start:253025 stop:254377 length:1353 start_codon:yes stop_codon:yes gene_type:complete
MGTVHVDVTVVGSVLRRFTSPLGVFTPLVFVRFNGYRNPGENKLNMRTQTFQRFLPLLAAVLLIATLVGCDAKIDRFEPNEVFALSLARSRDIETVPAMNDTTTVIAHLFGTPNEPKWPADWIGDATLSGIIDADELARAAGPVASDRQGVNIGLYRKHCVDCHGLPGNGTGGASMIQNPYPRNFRHGVFKWKSTARTAKPTRDDLITLLHQGIPGTAMPSFSLLDASDAATLIDYVIYLSVRGEVERRMMAAAVDELGYEATPPEEAWRLNSDERNESISAVLVKRILRDVISTWRDADTEVVNVGPEPTASDDERKASIKRGQDIFHGQIANCIGCHGPGGNGQAVTVDYDDWAKEYSTNLGITPTDRDAMRPFRDAGALSPRQIKPRNLQDGVFRGGGDPETIYRRIVTGIAGTPMPSVEVVSEENGKGLTSDQVWDLVRYVKSLSE